MNRFARHFRTHIFRGLIAIIPLGLTVGIVYLLYDTIDRRLVDSLAHIIGIRIPGLGILLSVVVLYLIGLLASNLIARQAAGLMERMMNRIPLIRTTYQVGKQIASTLVLPEKRAFRRAILVPYLKGGQWTVGFETGYIRRSGGDSELLLKVFVPTPPNPTSGTLVLIPESEVLDPGWTVEEAFKTVISAGLIGPTELS